MKKVVFAAVIVAVGLLVWLFVSRTPPAVTDKTASQSHSQPKDEVPILPTNVDGENGNTNSAAAAGSSPSAAVAENASPSASIVSMGVPTEETAEIAPALPPATVLDNCRMVIHHYHGAFGENPVGNNAEIAAALMGKNSKQITFIREDAGLRLNDKGELLDGWGTPFFFHQVSADVMEIRSAGEDRKPWTYDDLVTR